MVTRKRYKKRLHKKGGHPEPESEPENKEELCSICHEPVLIPGSVYIHNCNNKFHYNCLQEWCRRNVNCTCPICRQIIEDLKPLNEERELLSQLIKGSSETVKKYDELKQKYNELSSRLIELTNGL